MEPGLPLSEVTIAEALKAAGYVSGSVGKWHLGQEPLYPEKQGFDVSMGGTNAMSVKGFFFPDWKGQQRGMTGEGRPGEYMTDRLTDEGVRFIEANKDNPFFLYLSHYAVHTPVQGKPELIEKYRRKVKPDNPQRNPVYAAMVESVDDSVGKIMRKLDELGIADRTVVFFMSDNGGMYQPALWTGDPIPPTSNLPLRAGKSTLYEGGVREPMIVKWPGVVKPGSTCGAPVISNDFFPTMVELAGLKPDPKNAVDGVSLVPLLKQKGRLKREALYWHFPHNEPDPSGAVRLGNHKLIEFFVDGRLELYNLAEDIGEQNNLAGKMPKKAAELREMLRRWRESVGAQMMTPNPDYKPAK
jgi:arylsulfatase A-like enzyme